MKKYIIDKFECKPEQFHNYVQISHHPVFKDDETATTKLRPGFNCSLKTGDKPSINEISYGFGHKIVIFFVIFVQNDLLDIS